MLGTRNSFPTVWSPVASGKGRPPSVELRPARAVKPKNFSGLTKLAFASLWLLVFAIPWEDAITISGFGTTSRLVGMIALGLGALALFERGRIRRPSTGHVIMALFVGVAAASYSWSLYPEGTLTQVITYLQLFMMVWLIWEFAVRTEDQIRLMQAYVLGTFVSGIDTVIRFLWHKESDYQRYAGAGLNANDLGLIMAISIPISYYLLIRSRGRVAWIYGLQLLLAGTTIVLTASRGAALSGLVALMIIPLTHAGLTGRQKVCAVLALVLLTTGVMVFTPETSWERLSTTPREFSRGTLTGRTLIWTAGWELFREHPYLGVGANAFRLTVSRVLEEPIRMGNPKSPAPPAHNTFLSVLVEQGVIGFLIFAALLGSLVLSLIGMPAIPRKLWIVCLVVWGVGVSSLTWEMRKPTWFLFGLLLAQSVGATQKIPLFRVRKPHLPDYGHQPTLHGPGDSLPARESQSRI